MKILSWIPRGLGNPRGFWILHDLLTKEEPNLVFLQETKVKTSFFTTKQFSLGYRNGLGLDCEGRSGGLAVLWKDDIDFEVLHFSSHHIHGVVTLQPEGDQSPPKWSLKGFYGYPNASWRDEVWNLVKSFHGNGDNPWLMLGDFNKILQPSKKLGGRDRPKNQMPNFWELLKTVSCMT